MIPAIIESVAWSVRTKSKINVEIDRSVANSELWFQGRLLFKRKSMGVLLSGFLAIFFHSAVFGVEIGFYSSGWTRVGISDGGLGKIFIYQVKYPPDPAHVKRISNAACAKEITILFRQEIDPNHAVEALSQNSVDDVANSIVNGYQEIECSGHSLIIDEENIYWGGRAEILESMYRFLADRLSIPIMQWYSSNKRNNAPGFYKWPILSADGWVFDQYTMEPKVYEKYVDSMIQISQKLYSIVWFSPQWEVGAGKRVENDEYWNEYGRERFVHHVNTNIRNNIPTLFFAFFLDRKNNPVPIYKIAESDFRVKKFYESMKQVFTLVENNVAISLSDVPSW